MSRDRIHPTIVAVALVLAAWPGPVSAGAPLETETARIGPRGLFEANASYEFQTSTEGTEAALPFAFEYALTRRVEFLAEPVPYTRIRPHGAYDITGPGDLEFTLNTLVRRETQHFPALAIALEVKVPTAESLLIGSDHYDGTAYLIASRRIGSLDVHANLGYTIVGHPPELPVHNVVDYALAGEYFIGQRWCVLAELTGNTAALPESGSETENQVAPEISGGETVGMVGARWAWTVRWIVALGISYDNNSAVLLRPGLTVRF